MGRLPVLLALAGSAVLGCGAPAPPVDRNLVLLTVDTLRADRLGSYGNRSWGVSPSPEVDALAARGVLFERAYVPRGQTHPSLASLLTGKYPATTGLRENGHPLGAEHTTLFERLQAAGYQTGVFLANFEVDHVVESWVARGADAAHDGFAGKRRQESRNESRFQRIWDDRVERAALTYLDRLDATRPFAVWIHFYDVHKPYNPPPQDLQRFGPTRGIPSLLIAPGDDSGRELARHLTQITLGQRPLPAEELSRILGLYDGTVRATDRRIGRVLRKLEQMGERSSTYIVFSSDHGDELFDHNRYFFHGASIYEGVVTVPLIVAGPDLAAGRRVAPIVQNIDVAPTVLELLHLPAAPEMEGRSLAPLLRGETREPPSPFAFVEWQDLIQAVSDGRHKLIYNPEHVHTRKSPYDTAPSGIGFAIDCLEGYDLEADPQEQRDLLEDIDPGGLQTGDELPEPFRPLYRALRDFLADPKHQRPFDPEALSAEDVERLRQLGYVAGESVSGARSDSVRKGPCTSG